MAERNGSQDGRFRTGAVVLAVAAVILGACGGAAAPSPEPTAVTKATLPPATAAPATTAPAGAPTAAVVNIEAAESETGFFWKADRLIVAAGEVTFNVTNKGKLTHELMVYPVQDVTEVLEASRLDKHAHGDDLIKGIVASEEFIEPGETVTVKANLAPGIYEIACHIRGQDADGATFTHFDKGQILTIAVTGTGGPAATVGTPASTLALEMKGEEAASWLFVPDHLVVPAGSVTFNVTNSMRSEHDVVIHPLLDTTKVVQELLEHGGHFDAWDTVKGVQLFHDLAPGKTDTKTLTLAPGFYMAACYMVSNTADGEPFIHRDRGQRIVFEVR